MFKLFHAQVLLCLVFSIFSHPLFSVLMNGNLPGFKNTWIIILFYSVSCGRREIWSETEVSFFRDDPFSCLCVQMSFFIFDTLPFWQDTSTCWQEDRCLLSLGWPSTWWFPHWQIWICFPYLARNSLFEQCSCSSYSGFSCFFIASTNVIFSNGFQITVSSLCIVWEIRQHMLPHHWITFCAKLVLLAFTFPVVLNFTVLLLVATDSFLNSSRSLPC